MIVGKRALPAVGLAGEGGPLAAQVALLVSPDDIVLAFEAREARAGRRVAAERGCLAICLPLEWAPPTTDPFVRQELTETLYHLLWELVHVFFEHRGLLEGRDARQVTTPARRASSIRSWASGDRPRGGDRRRRAPPWR